MGARAVWGAWAGELLRWVYPSMCRLCRAELPGLGELACAAHRLPTGPSGPRCGRCAASLAAMLPDGTVCAGCRRRGGQALIQRTICLGDYREHGALRDWLLACKHGGRRDLGLPLGAALGEVCAAAADGPRPGEILVPVPLHPWRRFERGYDQALEIALGLGVARGLEVRELLERTRSTPPQGALSSPPRERNVAGAFRAVPLRTRRLAGRGVWVVDDVATSGATGEAAALALRRAGLRPRGLVVLAVARSSDGRQT